MQIWCPARKSKALKELTTTVFRVQKSDVVKTNIGIVSTHWDNGVQMIFKNDWRQVHNSNTKFIPGFGCTRLPILSFDDGTLPW